MKQSISGKSRLSFSLALVLAECGGGDGGGRCAVSEPSIRGLWVPVTQPGEVQALGVTIAPSGEIPCPTDELSTPGEPPPIEAAGAPAPPFVLIRLDRPVTTAFDSDGNL